MSAPLSRATRTVEHPVTAPTSQRTSTEAIIWSLLPGVTLAIAAVVARFLDIGIGEVVIQLTAIAAVVAGGKYARDRVVSVDTHDRVVVEAEADVAEHTAANLRTYIEDEIETEVAAMTQQWEALEQAAALTEEIASTDNLDPLPEIGS